MTGYGRGQAENAYKRYKVEIKSVNHKYADITVKAPKSFMAVEDRVKSSIAKILRRGKMDVFISYEDIICAEGAVKADIAVAKAYKDALEQLSAELDIKNDITLSLITRFPDVISADSSAENIEENWPAIEEAVLQAANALKAMSETEGGFLVNTIEEGIKKIGECVEKVAKCAPAVISENFDKYRQRIQKLLDGAAPDEARLLQEAAVFADKYDINEEIVRLRSHLGQFGKIIAEGDMVGKKLDFLIQEMNRETNTIGSKANDIELSGYVVFMKNEIEKIREQVQNLE